MATLTQLENALRKADAAGNVEDARAFANAIRQMRSTAPPIDVPRGTDDRFSDVQSTAAHTDLPEPRKPFVDIATDAAGKTARTFAQGIGGLLDTAETYSGSSLAREGLSYLPGFAGAGGPPRFRELIEHGLTHAGVPEYEGAAERVLGGVGEAAFGAALTGGAAALPRAGLQTASAGLGAAAGGIAREMGGSPRQQLAASLAGGLLPGAAMGRGATRGLSDADRAIVQAAQQRGIDLPLTAVRDSRTLEALRSIPGAGAKGRHEARVARANEVLAESVGIKEPIITKAANAAKKAADKRTLDDVMARNEMVINAAFVRRVDNILDNSKVSASAERAVRKQVDDLMNSAVVTPNGVRVPGTAYQALHTTLGQISGARNAAQPHLRHLREALEKQMDASISPVDAKIWAKWRQEYGDRKALQPLIAKAGDRPIDPRDLLAVVSSKAYNSQTRMAEGRRGELGTLADIGQRIVPPTPASVPLTAAGGVGLGAGAMANAPAAVGIYGLLNALGRRADRRVLSEGNRLSTLGLGAAGAAQGVEQTRRTSKKKKGKK